eukprot:536430-Hanusia_phi.AAC.2
MGNIDLDVVKNASSWSEGIRKYQEQKREHPSGGETRKPHYITKYFMSRQEAIVNPITQKFNDGQTEQVVKQMEETSIAKTLNRAWDTQLFREQHFDIVTQAAKRGHIHEKVYQQILKPPSLVTATHTDYNIISGKGFHEHHWAPLDKRPPRPASPQKKQKFLTALNRPREYDILTNQYTKNHEERAKWEMDRNREDIVQKYWETRDFDAVTCAFYDKDKEAAFQEHMKDKHLNQGSSAINKLPPTLAASESLMYDICTGVVRDPVRLQQIIDVDNSLLHARAQKMEKETLLRDKSIQKDQMLLNRKLARISHDRYAKSVDRGYDIVNLADYDTVGHPPFPQTRAKKSLWEFHESLRRDAGVTPDPHRSNQQNAETGTAGNPRSSTIPSRLDMSAVDSRSQTPKMMMNSSQGEVEQKRSNSRSSSLSGMSVRSGGFRKG